MVHTVARRRAIAALAATPLVLATAAASAQARSQARSQTGGPGGSIPRGYAGVDPRTATRVPLWHELSPANPIFEGDPEFTYETFTTIADSGYLLERVTSLGTHTGTHVSAPAHFVEGGRYLSELTESWTLMPLAVIDVRARIDAEGGDFALGVDDLRLWERRFGRIPEGGCVLLLTGFAEVYAAGSPSSTASSSVAPAHHGHGSYFDDAPGVTGEATAWLYDRRSIEALGSDTFGPDTTGDTEFSATLTALQKGGITVENVGPGLSRMRPHGDWISINGARPRFSGFQMGVTGFTR